MARFESWFRPWLDDPGPWDHWELDPSDEETLAALLRGAAGPARVRLENDFAAEARRFGATALVDRLAAAPPDGESLFRTALALAAADHYRARVAPPRRDPGGSTNPANRERWAALRPYLLRQLHAWAEDNAADSLVWRAVAGRIADDWIPAEQIGRSLERQLSETGLFTSVAVELDLKPPVPGGSVWLRARTAETLERIREALAQRQPVPVEVLRDPLTAPAAAQILVVYRLEDRDDGWLSLTGYDPVAPDTPQGLRLQSGPDGLRVREPQDGEGRPAVKGLRCIAAPPGEPPLFGWRRRLRWVLPWGLFWYLGRRWRLFRDRKHDRG
ncbi:hypothetical protein [Pelagibius sp.]|uniref:hypothetical protein n=1 Tax=Pelagibius sp. TaxID=1931238 RepID=UPI003B5058F9